MMKNLRQILLASILVIPGVVFAAGGSSWHLDKAPINLKDKSSLQRGAKIFMNYCQGCHSAKYTRYSSFAQGIGMVDKKSGELLKPVLQQNLMFNTQDTGTTVHTSLQKSDANAWFGTVPPDLTLTARERGEDWLYTYLRTFYQDDTKIWGVNNAVFPGVGMPHVLLDLQGVQEAVYEEEKQVIAGEEKIVKVLKSLEITQPGSVSPEEYDKIVADLVNFLAYIGEPMKLERQRLGIWVLLFLGFFFVVAYALKKEFWRDVH